MTFRIEALTGAALQTALPDLARLRIEVFREWPYLYDGSYDYESTYLANFAASEGSVVVAAIDGDRIVGAATATPMGGHAAEFAEPFKARNFDIAHMFYFGESVLLQAYRGRGYGHAFFDQREARARTPGRFTHCTFCAVVRPADHPLRPANARTLESFWHKRGYAPVESLVGTFDWLDIGDSVQTAKPMQFWMKAL